MTKASRAKSPAREKHWMPRFRTLLCCVVSVGCFIVVCGNGILYHLRSGLERATARALLVVVAIVVSWIAYHIDWRKLIANNTNKADPPFQPDERSLAELQRGVNLDSLALDTKGLVTFIELMTDPARYRTRVSETVDLAERQITQQVSIELSIPHAALSAKYLYLPILMPLKGELLDNFRLYNSSGTSLPNLSYVETTHLIAAGLRFLLAADKTASAETVAVDEIVLLGPVARRGVIKPTEADKEIEERLNALKIDISDVTYARLLTYLSALSASYPIVVVLPPSSSIAGRILVKYERSIIPVSERKGLEGKLRLALGIRPHQVAIPVNLAFTSASYHLRLNGPADKFVIRQYLCCKHCGQLVRRNWQGRVSSDPPSNAGCQHSDRPDTMAARSSHFRLRQRRGQSYVHLYMRGYAERQDRLGDFELLARFKEVPPGSLANAAATALLTTLLIGVTGYICTHNSGNSYSDLPALILALPIAAASWLGISEDGGKLVGSSLLARVSLIMSTILAIFSIVTYLALAPIYGKSNASSKPTRIMDDVFGMKDFAVLDTYNWLWILLTGLALLALAYVSFRFSVRLTYYNYLRRKSDVGMTEYGN